MVENQTETPIHDETLVERRPTPHGDIVVPRPIHDEPTLVAEMLPERNQNGDYVELIEYPSAKAARAAIPDWYSREEVLLVELIDLGKTLRVTSKGDQSLINDTLNPVEDAAAQVAALTSGDVSPVALGEGQPEGEPTEAGAESSEAAPATPVLESGTGELNPATGEPAEAAQEPILEPVGDQVGQELIGTLDGSEIVSDEPSEIQLVLAKGTGDLDRDAMRDLNTRFELGVDIPVAGPLGPVRERIADALANKE